MPESVALIFLSFCCGALLSSVFAYDYGYSNALYDYNISDRKK